jgi:hypothetical protein
VMSGHATAWVIAPVAIVTICVSAVWIASLIVSTGIAVNAPQEEPSWTLIV